MSDYFSIQEVGGEELACHYPDRGLIPQAQWHKAIFTAATKASGWRSLFQKSESFTAVLSANADGLRVFVSLENFAVFIPWSEASVSAERSMPGTVVRLQTAAVPSVRLEFHLDDAAADELFCEVIKPLPQRDPPGRLYWPRPWALAMLLSIMLIAAGILAWLRLSPTASLVATVATGIGIWLLWMASRPILEEHR